VTAVAVWAGIVVADVEASAGWYARTLGGEVAERVDGWAKVVLRNGTSVELFAGDREQLGRVFPSYGADPGPPVMPGYAVEEPAALVELRRLLVARSLPDWIVVSGPDRLRVVLTTGTPGPGRGLLGFRYTTDGVADEQRAFFDSLGVADPLQPGEAVGVVPIFGARRDAQITDPDGTAIELCR
jgi:catechol 2,3-dioxygenase-like lactoylglutathione lyase family enzyme